MGGYPIGCYHLGVCLREISLRKEEVVLQEVGR